ncbi:MAG: mechanosensitive ion channel family protein [Chloroflexi bacterium]|nr:mechanosensitive ion channel family protein [Chloroflexota bacterium]
MDVNLFAFLTTIDWGHLGAAALVFLLRVALMAALALLAYWLVRRWIPPAADLILRAERRLAGLPAAEEQAARRDTLRHLLLRTIQGLLVAVVGVLVLAELGLNLWPLLAGTGALGAVLRVTLTVALALLLHRLAERATPHLVELALRVEQTDLAAPVASEEQAKRRDTLSHVLLRTLEVLLVVIGGFMVLAELGFNLAPLIASAGIAGIAIGFGAQSLIRDLFAGIFILLENQYGKGDVVKIAGVAGIVEDVNLRRTVLRDLDGIVHSVPNGEVRVASNFTRGWSRVNLNVLVGYDQDLDRVRAVLDRVGEELAADPEWAPLILEAPKVLRVDAFEESGIALKVLATTKPIKQWDVAGELRRRIKAAFDAEGISIPFPHRVVVIQQAERPGAAPEA